MAQPRHETRIRVGVRDGVRDVVRPGSKKSALVRDVESGVGGRRGDAGKDAWERNFRRVAVRELAVLFRPGVWKILEREL